MGGQTKVLNWATKAIQIELIFQPIFLLCLGSSSTRVTKLIEVVHALHKAANKKTKLLHLVALMALKVPTSPTKFAQNWI